MAGSDADRYIQIATLAAFAVALLCFIAWLLRLSILVRLISESILIGFKAGAGLTIAASQLPNLLGVPGGGHNFSDRIIALAGELGSIHYLALAVRPRRTHALDPWRSASFPGSPSVSSSWRCRLRSPRRLT